MISAASKYTIVFICLAFSAFGDAAPQKEETVETNHEIAINGQKISYKATVGTYLLKDQKGQPKASIFYVSYIKTNNNNELRPVTFCFNGGPGSSSVWLHMGFVGPKRVVATYDNGFPPTQLVDNDYSLLDQSDLVFIDPVSTGYSRAIPPDEDKPFLAFKEDVESVCEFIRLYITKNDAWESPKFLLGESYGTTRAAGVADYLQNNINMFINGIILLSPVLDFQTMDFHEGNDLPYSLYLPTYTATAWYYKKLSTGLQADFDAALNKACAFAVNPYLQSLFMGNLISQAQKEMVVGQLAALTGLTADYIEKSNLRVSMFPFTKELLRDKNRTIGYHDVRCLGIGYDQVAEYPEYNASGSDITGAYTSGFYHYVRSDLNWPSTENYEILAMHVAEKWNYESDNQYLNVTPQLRDAMTQNPYLTVFVAMGYFDLATPYFATEYTLNHLGLDPTRVKNLTRKHYHSGHMIYTDPASLKQLKEDLDQYYKKSMQDIKARFQPGNKKKPG